MSLERCYRHVPPGGGQGEDRGHKDYVSGLAKEILGLSPAELEE